METNTNVGPAPNETSASDLRQTIRNVIEEFVVTEKQKAEPAYKQELAEERKRREHLERRMNELVEENQRNRQAAEHADRASQVRAELQRLGVAKVDLAFRVVREDIARSEDGSLVAKTQEGEKSLKEYLAHFVQENPEFLPPRIAGGSGSASASRSTPSTNQSIDLERIRPGMSKEDLQRVRDQIALVATQNLRGE